MSLPDLVLFEDFEGDWERYIESVYQHFYREVVRGGLYLLGKPIKCKFMPATNGKGFSFWHVVSEGETEEDRTPDLRRCERIRWIAWLIASYEQAPAVKWWRTVRRNRQRIVIWHEEGAFAVVLEERESYMLLCTAYHVAGGRADKFRREWEEHWRA